ncbi:MAG: hypothetical protein ACYCU0_06230 [Solirubrobacteraceae bacterium]
MRARLTSVAAVAAAMSMGFVGVASASAAEFESNNPGGKIKGHATSTQVFKAEAGGGAVECKTAETGGTAVGKSATQEVSVKYESCTAFGEPATVSLAEYTFNVGSAPVGTEPVDGTAAVKNTITISVPLAGCEITVGKAGNEALKTVEFTNSGEKLIEKTNVSGITDKVTGGIGFCGKEGENKNGTYTGNSEIEVEGGTSKVN